MPPKQVQCIVCGEMINKRQTLAYENGRACRKHEEVIEAIEEMREKIKMEKQGIEAENKLAIISLVSMIRAFHTIRGIPMIVLYEHVKRTHPDLLSDIKAEIAKRGEKMSQDEVTTSLLTYGALIKKASKGKG